jgi:hypothetical protein
MGIDLTVCVLTRNKSITVSTLHTLLNLSSACFQGGHRIFIHFVEELSSLSKLVKTQDRILWINYGYALDQESFPTIFASSHECLVYPCVTENVSWDSFKKRLETLEPLHQKALSFDTDVDIKISDGYWRVKKTCPNIFLIDCKSIDKKLRTRKGEGLKIPNDIESLFSKFTECGVKMIAYTKANVIVHKYHECIGNIMENASVKFVN